jgi:aspartate ammonia-lyase
VTDLPFRVEHDLLGDKAVPGNAYYGIHTARAIENFPITGQTLAVWPALINALATIKLAAAQANHELGLLDSDICGGITAACQEIRDGQFRDQFVVDLIQGGAGTSTNMNANEVIANRALELLGHVRGEYRALHPIEHVNLCQSTNDVYPTALKIASHLGSRRLIEAMMGLRISLEAKAIEFSELVKVGRTQLQDAVPMTLGQEFGVFADMISDEEERLAEASRLLCKINMGATAIGTGVTAHPSFAELVRRNLVQLTDMPLYTADNLIAATQDCAAFVHLSSVLKGAAIKLSKICNDLRLLSSGPRAGLAEINLPSRQAGSSIMPGKVNPVIPEAVNQVAFEVIGNDVTIALAAEAGQLQLNAFEPIMGYCLFQSLGHLEAVCVLLDVHCIRGITANNDRLQMMTQESIGAVTALIPYIGYLSATEIATEAMASGRSVFDIVSERKLFSEDTLHALLRGQPAALQSAS